MKMTQEELAVCISDEFPISTYDAQMIVKMIMEKLNSAPVSTDWGKLRDDFFKDCVREEIESTPMGDMKMPVFKLMPHNVFEWFKKKLGSQQHIPDGASAVSLPCASGDSIVEKHLFEITYFSSYGSGTHFQYSTIAKTKQDALEKFWDGKNKESFQIYNVVIKESFQAIEQGSEADNQKAILPTH